MTIARGLLSSAILVVLTMVGSLLGLGSWLVDRSGDGVLWLARIWSGLVLRAAGVKVEAEIEAPLDGRRAYLFMANHQSMVDIWALFVTLPVPVRMIAKKQLGRIPLLGWVMNAGRFIFIDRENPMKARRSMQEAAARIAGGASVLIFPEGTRSRDGTLGPFKKGGFHLAVDAAVPIVPVAIAGAREVMPRGSPLLRPGRVRVKVGAPVPVAGLRHEDVPLLLDRVRSAIAEMLGEAAGARAAPPPQ